MPNPISSVDPTQRVAQLQAFSPKPSPSRPASKTATIDSGSTARDTGVDTVKLSAAARALLEARETGIQTAQEANSGDLQARRLLAKETVAQKAGGR